MKKLIITGFFRSGTSLLAKFLSEVGYNTGGDWNESINAGYEDENFSKIVTTFQMNSFTEDLILHIVEEIKKVNNIVIKHPRVLFNPEFLRIWTLVYPDTSFLVTYREPIYSLQSKNKYGNFGYFSNFSSSELDNKFHTFIDTLLHLRLKYHILYFPDFLSDYNKVYHSISALGIHFDKEKGYKVWNNIVDLEKVHFGRGNL